MRARVLCLFALTTACTPEPEDAPGGETTASQALTTSQQSGPQSTEESSSSDTDTDPGASALEIHALTPEIWSGRRLRKVYQAGDDGSIGTRLSMFWDVKLKTHCELDDSNRRLGGLMGPGDKLYCFPFMGKAYRCETRYRDPQCSQSVLIAWADVDDVYQELFQVVDSLTPDAACEDPPAGLYKVTKFNKHELGVYYYRNDKGECLAQKAYERNYHTVELGAQVPMDMLAGGTLEVD